MVVLYIRYVMLNKRDCGFISKKLKTCKGESRTTRIILLLYQLFPYVVNLCFLTNVQLRKKTNEIGPLLLG